MEYQGIIFPDRAEAVREEQSRHNKVFLSHWTAIANKLRQRFEDLAIRGVGGQDLSASAIGKGSNELLGDDNNLWSLWSH